MSQCDLWGLCVCQAIASFSWSDIHLRLWFSIFCWPYEKTLQEYRTALTSQFLDAQASLAPTPVSPSVRDIFGFPFCQRRWALTKGGQHGRRHGGGHCGRYRDGQGGRHGGRQGDPPPPTPWPPPDTRSDLILPSSSCCFRTMPTQPECNKIFEKPFNIIFDKISCCLWFLLLALLSLPVPAESAAAKAKATSSAPENFVPNSMPGEGLVGWLGVGKKKSDATVQCPADSTEQSSHIPRDPPSERAKWKKAFLQREN